MLNISLLPQITPKSKEKFNTISPKSIANSKKERFPSLIRKGSEDISKIKRQRRLTSIRYKYDSNVFGEESIMPDLDGSRINYLNSTCQIIEIDRPN